MSDVIRVDSATFRQEVIESDVPVLVDFTARWCGPGRQIESMMADLAREFAGAVKVTSIDTDDSQDVAGQFGIRGLPTVMLFKGGEEIARICAKGKGHFMAWVDENL